MSIRNPFPSRAEARAPRAPERRPRDFGVGYGRSSGYAGNRRYLCGAVAQRFRFA